MNHLILYLLINNAEEDEGAPRTNYSAHGRIDFNNLPIEDVLLFRFTLSQLRLLCTVLKLDTGPMNIKGYMCSGLECLAIVCRRLAYPGRLCDLVQLFGRSQSSLDEIFLYGIEHIYANFKHLLEVDVSRFMRLKAKAQEFAQAINRKGCPIENVFLWVDGTKEYICRPSRNQESMFDGHHRQHALTWLNMTLPNGIILVMYGPKSGQTPDCVLWSDCKIQNVLETVFPNGEYCVYGDLGFIHLISKNLLAPFPTDHKDFNYAMSSGRIANEWSNGLVTREWAFLDYKHNLKVLLSPLAKEYVVAVLLTNFLTCLRGSNEISQYFNLSPPTIDEYLNY